MNWYLAALKDYCVFTGRAHRTAFWTFFLVNIVISLAVSYVDLKLGFNELLAGLYSIALLLPSLGIAARRLHDTGRSAWWLLINFVPMIGTLVLFVFFVFDSEPEANRFGPNPKVEEGRA